MQVEGEIKICFDEFGIFFFLIFWFYKASAHNPCNKFLKGDNIKSSN
jgi:hypothetical protein